MFRQDHQSTVALTLEYTHSYDIFHANGPTTTASTWRKQVNSIKQLRHEYCELYDQADELQEQLNESGEKNSQHVSIKINGLINGKPINDLQIDSLDGFKDFILANQHSNTLESSPQNHPKKLT
jgi:hypothetical protein